MNRRVTVLNPGTYIVAVSGGVDSMVLLHMLATQKPSLTLVVAHFDHGIRSDSAQDRKLVEKTAASYGLPFVYKEGKLGPRVSEATAREVRYAFLRQILHEYQADAIVTAHHQDDLLETAILNMLRGTGRKGLSSLRSHHGLLRPLLDVPKAEILEYAATHSLAWREDSTNADERYLRNYIRRNILTRFTEKGRQLLLDKVRAARKVNDEIDLLINKDLEQQRPQELSRGWYIQLPYAVAAEMMAMWLRRNGIAGFDRTIIDRLVVAAKTARPGKLADINAGYILQITKDKVRLRPRGDSSGS